MPAGLMFNAVLCPLFHEVVFMLVINAPNNEKEDAMDRLHMAQAPDNRAFNLSKILPLSQQSRIPGLKESFGAYSMGGSSRKRGTHSLSSQVLNVACRLTNAAGPPSSSSISIKASVCFHVFSSAAEGDLPNETAISQQMV